MSALSERFRLWEILLGKLEHEPRRWTDLERAAVRDNNFSSAMFRKALRDLKLQGYIRQEKKRAPYEITPSGLLWLRSRRRNAHFESDGGGSGWERR
jgi:DNA-binding PadR family transcriptional regulator